MVEFAGWKGRIRWSCCWFSGMLMVLLPILASSRCLFSSVLNLLQFPICSTLITTQSWWSLVLLLGTSLFWWCWLYAIVGCPAADPICSTRLFPRFRPQHEAICLPHLVGMLGVESRWKMLDTTPAAVCRGRIAINPIILLGSCRHRVPAPVPDSMVQKLPVMWWCGMRRILASWDGWDDMITVSAACKRWW